MDNQNHKFNSIIHILRIGYAPEGMPINQNKHLVIVVRNIAPSVDRSCSSSLNGSDPKQISEWQRMKTFPKFCKHLEQLFDDKLVYLQNMSNKQEHQSYQNIIHTSILVTKESSNIYMWDQYNRYVGHK